MAAQPSMFQNAWSARLFNSKTLLWIIIIKAYQTTTAKKTKKTKLRSVAKCMFCVFFSSPTLASQLRWDGNFFTSPLNFYNTHWTLEYVNLHLKYTHNARFFYCFAVRLTCQTHIWKSDFWMRGFEVFLTWFFFFFDVYMDWNQIICNKKKCKNKKNQFNFTISKMIWSFVVWISMGFLDFCANWNTHEKLTIGIANKIFFSLGSFVETKAIGLVDYVSGIFVCT